MRILVLLFLAAALNGCSKADVNKTVEDVTGKTAVMQGEKAKEKIKAVSAEENKQLNEILDK